jgi:hypothetical protein
MRRQKQVREVVSMFKALCLIVFSVFVLQACDHGGEQTKDSTYVDANAGAEKLIPNAPWPVDSDIPVMKTWDEVAALPEDVVHRLMRQGYAGDPKSAVVVAEFQVHLKPPDKDAELKWRQIAAENGDVASMTDVAWSEQLMGGEDRCLRAKFWLMRAAEKLSQTDEYRKDKNSTPYQDVGLFVLRDKWQECVSGNAATYLGTKPLDAK